MQFRLGAPRWLWLMLAVSTVMAAWFSTLELARRADGQTHDMLTSLQSASPPPAQFTIIDIDERSLQEVGPWPWPRTVIAELAHQLREKGARLQVWDMFFSHPSPSDERLLQEMARPDVVVGVVPVLDALIDRPPTEGVLPGSASAIPFCSRHAPVTGYLGLAPQLAQLQAGHLSSTPDPDGRLRRIPAVICMPQSAGQTPMHIPQLTLAAAAAAEPQQPWRIRSGQWPWEPDRWLHRGSWKFAVDKDGYLNIPYRRPHAHWPAISASSLLLGDESLPTLKGHVVLIGGTALGIRDVVSTPYHPNAPGVSVHAELLTAASTPGAWVDNMPQSPAVMAALMAFFAGVWLIPLARPDRKILALMLGLAVGALAPVGLAWLGRTALGVMLPVTAPVLALMSYTVAILGLQLLLQRRQTTALSLHLQSFLPPRLARQIATQVPTGQSLGQSHTGVLAAVRVDGMTRWVSKVDSLQSLALIHAVHTTAVQVAMEHGGQLEYVQGDTLYMSWSEASACPKALACMQKLHQRLDPVLERNATMEAPLILYAALESGSFLLGVVGAQGGRRSVLLGPAVNDIIGILDLSSELDSFIIVGPRAAQGLMEAGHSLQPLGQFLLLDQPDAKSIYRVSV